MSPPDSERSRILPTLTWESLVDPQSHAAPTTDASTEVPTAADTDPPAPDASPPVVPEPPSFMRPPPLDVPPAAPATGDLGPMSLSLHLGDISPVPPPPAPPVRRPISVQPVEEFHVTFPPLTLPDDVGPEPGSSLGPEIEPDVEPEPEMTLPTIREATPVQPYISDEIPMQPAAGCARHDRRPGHRCQRHAAGPWLASRTDLAAAGDTARPVEHPRPDRQPARRRCPAAQTAPEATRPQRSPSRDDAVRARRDRRGSHRLRTPVSVPR